MERICKKCGQSKDISNFVVNRKWITYSCKVCTQTAWKLKYDSDLNFRLKINEKNRDYRSKTKARRNEYEANKRKNDIIYRLKINIRGRISEILTNKKRDKSINLLGCTVGEFKDYLSSKFLPGMTWENYGYYGWHIDHITPCDAFDLSDPAEQQKCFHYTNLQPLWAKDNMRKSNKISP